MQYLFPPIPEIQRLFSFCSFPITITPSYASSNSLAGQTFQQCQVFLYKKLQCQWVQVFGPAGPDVLPKRHLSVSFPPLLQLEGFYQLFSRPPQGTERK